MVIHLILSDFTHSSRLESFLFTLFYFILMYAFLTSAVSAEIAVQCGRVFGCNILGGVGNHKGSYTNIRHYRC